jgi:transposase-like protein
MPQHSPFRYFKTGPEIIRLAVMLYIRYLLSLRNVEDLLHERGIEISHETVPFWRNRFGPMFTAEIRKRRVERMRPGVQHQWHLDEVFVKINGETHYLWRAVDHEGEVAALARSIARAMSWSCSTTETGPRRRVRHVGRENPKGWLASAPTQSP